MYSCLDALWTSPATCHGSFKATRHLTVYQQTMRMAKKPVGLLCCIERLRFVAVSHPRHFIPRQKQSYSIQDANHKASLALVQHTWLYSKCLEMGCKLPLLPPVSVLGGDISCSSSETGVEFFSIWSTSESCLEMRVSAL